MTAEEGRMPPPTVHAVTVSETATTRLVTVVCPYCRAKHTHGWPYGTTTIGHRSAHCWRKDARAISSAGYYVTAPGTTHQRSPR